MGPGRPRKTDPEAVLEAAMKLFWERGYEGTSMNDLAATSGMAKPGLYATFGDKEALYAKALTHYFEAYGLPLLDDIVQSPDPLEVVTRRSLERVASAVIDENWPGGCLVVNSVIECAHQSPCINALGKHFSEMRYAAFAKRFRAAKAQGSLPANMDARALAEFFSGQTVALAVMGRSGASREQLDRFIDVAMTALPTAKRVQHT